MEYKYVRAWNIMMGSFDYYINGQVAKAKQDNAPEDAIYKNHVDKWVTFSEIKNEETKRQVADIVKRMSFEVVVEIREGRWNDWCQMWNEGETEYGAELYWHVYEDRDMLELKDGTLIAEWKNNKVYVYDKDFFTELTEMIEWYEKDTGVILRDYLSDKLFTTMTNEQIIERLSQLQHTMYYAKSEYHQMCYDLSEKAKAEILKRMK